MTTQEISLSQITPSVHQQIKAVQGDTGRQLRMNITDRYFSSATAGLYFERSDHTNYSVSCALVNGSFEADITQALTQPGVTKCQLKVTESNKVVSTYTFQILVEKNVTGTATPQENYTIEEALSKAEQAVTTADQAVETANNLVSDLQDDIEEAQGYIDSFEHLQETLDNKANVDGTYPSLTAGLAEQLLSKNRVVDQTPYLYRQTALGKANATRALMRKIVGGSVVWNQSVPTTAASRTPNGVTFTNNKNGSWTITGTPTTNNVFNNLNYSASVEQFKLNHIYLVVTNLRGSNSDVLSNIGLWLSGIRNTETGSSTSVQIYRKEYAIIKAYWVEVPSYTRLQIANISGTDIGTVTIQPQIFDLTALFGSATIADYIYSLEQATAGSGIAKLKEWGFFTEDYYDYDPGTMRSVEGVSAKETVGFNLWDGTKNSGYIDNTGRISASANYYYTDYVRVFPNTEYHFHGTGGSNPSVVWYDGAKEFISGTKNNNETERTLTSPSNARYVRASFPIENVDIFCINLSDQQRNGEYEPYVKHTYPLDSSLTLRGIPKLVDNELVYDGDEYAADGTVARRYGIVDLGTLNWTYSEGSNINFRSTTPLSDAKLPTSSSDIIMALCPKYDISNYFNATINDKALAIVFSGSSAAGRVWISDSDYTDTVAFKASLSGVMLLYELATPTTETAEPYSEVQVVDKNGTEEFVSTSLVPVGHYTEYPKDLVAKLDSIPELPTDNGTYQLQATVNSGVVTYTWVAV